MRLNFKPRCDYYVLCETLDQAHSIYQWFKLVSVNMPNIVAQDGRSRLAIFSNNKRIQFITKFKLTQVLNYENPYATRIISSEYFSRKLREFEQKEGEKYEEV